MDSTDTAKTRNLSMTRDAVRKRRKRWAAAIKRSNERFAAMTPVEKRVQIAKDVIAALDSNGIVAQKGTYGDFVPVERRGSYLDMEFATDAYYAARDEYWKGDAQDAILEGSISCNVCAIGAVFTCAVARMDKLTLKDLEIAPRSSMLEYVSEFFDKLQLELMECAFELNTDQVRYDHDDDDLLRKAVDFGYAANIATATMTRAEARMRAIMENIIANGGEFRP